MHTITTHTKNKTKKSKHKKTENNCYHSLAQLQSENVMLKQQLQSAGNINEQIEQLMSQIQTLESEKNEIQNENDQLQDEIEILKSDAEEWKQLC